MKKKESKRQNNLPLEMIIKDDNLEWCDKGGIATSYTYNIDAPELPICKAHGYCSQKIEYDGKNCCLKMYEIYRREIE